MTQSHGRLHGLSSSGLFIQIFSPAMVDDPESDVTPLLQLGAAVMLDKPILVVVRPEDEARLPKRLRQVADRVVVTDADPWSESTVARIVTALDEINAQSRAVHEDGGWPEGVEG